MNRRKIILTILAMVGCGLFAVVFWPEKPEPVYKGKKLSEWVRAISNGGMGFSDEYPKAVHAIGTNGIPFYLEWYLYKPGFLKRARFNLAMKCFYWFGGSRFPDDHTETTRVEAAGSALEELGELAAPAIPQLVYYATNSPIDWGCGANSRGTSPFDVLSYIGRPAVPAYMCLLTNANPIVRAGAAEAAGLYVYIDPSILAQVRILLHDPEESVRRAADHSLSAYMPPEDLKPLQKNESP